MQLGCGNANLACWKKLSYYCHWRITIHIIIKCLFTLIDRERAWMEHKNGWRGLAQIPWCIVLGIACIVMISLSWVKCHDRIVSMSAIPTPSNQYPYYPTDCLYILSSAFARSLQCVHNVSFSWMLTLWKACVQKFIDTIYLFMKTAALENCSSVFIHLSCCHLSGGKEISQFIGKSEQPLPRHCCWNDNNTLYQIVSSVYFYMFPVVCVCVCPCVYIPYI